jgi:hypothetical protein
LALIACFEPAAGVRAGDYQLQASTRFDAFEIDVPGSPIVLVRRRLVQSLGLGYAQLLGPEDEPFGRFVARTRVRFDFDFGSTCTREGECVDPTNADDPLFYVPIARERGVDVPELWVGLVDLPGQGEVRAGRLLRLGTIGMIRYDGAAAGVSLRRVLRVEAYAGQQVRTTSLAGSYGFEPLASLRLELPDGAIPLAPGLVAPPSRTYVAGVDAATLAPAFARARLGYRESWDGDGLVQRRIAFGATSEPAGGLRLQADGVVDLRDGSLIDVVGVIAHHGKAADARIVLERHEPRFDPGTIWGWFDLVPVASARIGGDVRVTRDVRLGGDLRGRRSHFGEEGFEHGAGVELRGSYQLPGGSVALVAEAQGGDLGPYGALRAYADHRLGPAASIALTASAFHFDDRLRVGYHGLSAHESVTFGYRISPEAETQIRVEHAYNALVGHRFRGFFLFLLELWR